MTVVFTSAPSIGTPYQDEPTANTQMNTSVGVVHVQNYRPVPVHMIVTDNSGRGISGVVMYYKVDATMATTAPTTGYSTITMTYSSTSSSYVGTIPFATNSRIWAYAVATDLNGATDRKPSTGSYTYDLDPDTTAPSCPLGLIAVKMAKKIAALSWQKNSEPDVIGYNIYRKQCGSWSKVYTSVTDQDASSPDIINYTDNASTLNLDTKCYGYYITAVDSSGNQSASCSVYPASAGACPCP
jgi:hypothetical protein